jgi:branched-chain amino acid transport system ATP-binding protein
LASPDVQSDPRLNVRGLGSGYGAKQVVFDIFLEVAASEIVAVLGHNGAGKTTAMSAVFGILPAREGTVDLNGVAMTKLPARDRVREGMSFVPSEKFVFPDLTVAENLSLGGFTEPHADRRRDNLAWVLDRWPILAERRSQLAGTMSGGQRRLLSLGVAMMSSPTMLLLDEPSLGLAPNIVDQLFADLRRMADERGLGVLIVEQSVGKVLAIADRAYVMRSGRIIAHETAEELAQRESLWELF